MAQLCPAMSTTSCPRIISADFAPTSNKAQGSILNSILPLVVQSHLPRLASLRRSVSMYRLRSRRKSADSRRIGAGARSGSSEESTSAMVFDDFKGYDGDDGPAYYAGGSSEDDFRPNTPQKRRGSRQEPIDSKKEISWKFARQGLHLLSSAVNESTAISSNGSVENAPFARQLYLHAITYILRALPSDLTPEERVSIRNALPEEVVQPLDNQRSCNSRTWSQSPEPPSLLHRTLASTIVQLFIIFQFVLPHLRHLLGVAYQYDQTHKISQRIVSQGFITINGIADAGVSISGTVYGMSDGEVGRRITDTATWVLEGVTGGIHEGIGEGLAVVGVIPRGDQRPRIDMR